MAAQARITIRKILVAERRPDLVEREAVGTRSGLHSRGRPCSGGDVTQTLLCRRRALAADTRINLTAPGAQSGPPRQWRRRSGAARGSSLVVLTLTPDGWRDSARNPCLERRMIVVVSADGKRAGKSRHRRRRDDYVVSRSPGGCSHLRAVLRRVAPSSEPVLSRGPSRSTARAVL